MQSQRESVEPKVDAELVETRVEERDGRRWVTGMCSNCASRVAVPMQASTAPTRAACPEGHTLRIGHLRSDVSHPLPYAPKPVSHVAPAAPGTFKSVGPADPDRDDHKALEPQPNGSTWGFEKQYNGPPEDGQPRVGSAAQKR